ncbi:MAG TPA: helix-turn-helix domain-containing protein [Candidatus Deferrimicrobium sp.]|nr:helix-turn-helix domain-containing protein [Candidatus Deferrimicrobium sp.]
MSNKNPSPQQQSNKIPDLKQKILSLLQNYTLSTREISQEIGATYATTLKHLEILHASALVEYNVYGKTHVWKKKSTNPFDLDINSLLYLLIKNLPLKSNQKSESSKELLENIMTTFYLHAIEIHLEKLRSLKTDQVALIQKYAELEKNLKWKDIQEYDIVSNESDIRIKIFDCKYKFGCCANLHEEGTEIFCIAGQKFPCLLKAILNQQYKLNLVDFSLDPSFCILQLNKI